ncbi:MAG: hypothetical protein ACTSVZ_14530 [Promethearchaeota archaeon]
MEIGQNSEEQDELLQHVKNALDNIQNIQNNPTEKEQILYDLIAYLISCSNDIAQQGDLYEAGGRLYSAGYFFEGVHPLRAKEIYLEANKYYTQYFHQKIKEGAVQEAANIALKIANLNQEKLDNRNTEREFVQTAITLFQNQITLLQEQEIGSLREISGKYQTLSILFTRLAQWDKVIENAQTALQIAKKINDISIIANSYHDLIIASEKQHSPRNASNYIHEGLAYFLNEAKSFEARQEFHMLAQVYQIIKNFYSMEGNTVKHAQYTGKEAGIYIALANKGIKGKMTKIQIASYYRGAALCYRDTGGTQIDAATCYYLAGNYYAEATDKIADTAINYHDAAKIFFQLQHHPKSIDLFMKAGEKYISLQNYELGIECLINAYEIAENISSEFRDEALNLLIDTLITYATIEENSSTYFSAATLQIEAIVHQLKQTPIDLKQIEDNLRKAYNNYSRFALISSNDVIQTSQLYAICLGAIIALYLHPSRTETDYFGAINHIEVPLALQYQKMFTHISQAFEHLQDQPLPFRDQGIADLYQNSIEIKKIYDVIIALKKQA